MSLNDTHQKDFEKIFNQLCYNHSRWNVWSDFVTMSAVAISNQVDKEHFTDRESMYLNIVSKYNKAELEKFAEMLACVVMGLEHNPDQDFLGELYMSLELGNDHAGQFFTPYSVCKCISAMTIADTKEKLKSQFWTSVDDPTCGAGALLVAFANECKANGINYQEDILFTGQDIDFDVGMMCYIQLSLMGCAGYVKIGDTLANPCTTYDSKGLIPKDCGDIWYTPMYFLDVWSYRRLFNRVDFMFSNKTTLSAGSD